MRIKLLLLLCGLCWWLGGAALAASTDKSYVVNGTEDGVLLQPYVLLAEDVNANASLTDILAQPRFQPASSRQLTPGYSRSAFWLRTRLQNPAPYPVTVWLETGTARLQEVTLYQLTGVHWQAEEAGTKRPFSVRPLDTTTPVFQVRLAAGESRELVWRIASETSISLLPRLWLPEHFRASEGTYRLLHGFEFGALTIMALYSLMLFFSLHRYGFAYYALSVLTYVIYEISITGFGFRYLWPEATFWATRIISLSATLSIAFFLLMFREFLDTRQHAPSWDCFLLGLLFCLCSVIGILLLDYRLGAQLGTVLSLAATATMPVLCLVLLYRGPVGGWAYGLASFASMLGNLARMMEILGSRVSDVMSVYGAPLGSIVSTGMLLTAFTLQMRRVRIQKEQAITSLLVLKEQQHDKLEQQVIARTVALDGALREAHEANQAKNRLLAHISHDLRAPLSIIIGYARLLYQPRTDSAVCLRAIEDNARHQLALIDELIDFSSNHLGEITLRPQDGAWADFLRSIVNDAQQLAAPHGNRFELMTDGETPPMLHLDFKRLRQVLANLLSNAAKFTRDGVIRLTVQAQQQNGQWSLAISVSDSGIGMSDDTLGRLFQPFRRGDNVQHTQGTGLGLVISAGLLAKMGGKLQADSTLGVGSTFSFCIPVALAHITAPDATTLHPQTAPLASGYRILLVDDHAQSRALTADWLQSAGHDVLEAADGYAALSLLAYHTVDAIVSDQQMPACDGWDLLATLRQQQTSPAVLLFSSMVACRPAHLPPTLDFDGYLQKPASPAQLQQLLHPLLPQSRSTLAAALSDTQLTELTTLLQDGRISDLEVWAQTLGDTEPTQRRLATQIIRAAQQLDIATLTRLADCAL